jgi:hypothetical protein
VKFSSFAQSLIRSDWRGPLSAVKIRFAWLRAGVWPPIEPLQLFWCSPLAIRVATRFFMPKPAKFLASGYELDRRDITHLTEKFIAGGDWDLHTAPIEDVAPVRHTLRRYREGLPWERTGELDWMMANIGQNGAQDGCRTHEEVLARCARLDALKAYIEEGGPFLTRKQIDPAAFRERGGIGVAVGRSGDLIWMDGGAHRLGIALALELAQIPIALVMVHSETLRRRNLFRCLSSAPAASSSMLDCYTPV